MTPAEFAAATGVSRETLERLSAYADLLHKWNDTINLVGRNTLPDLWSRHMHDSAQLFPLIPKDASSLVDLGSGAGFPGLVLALMGAPDVHLVEADQRKSTFLREAARLTGARVTVHAQRIERIEGLKADVITARGLSDLPELLNMAINFANEHSILLFLKGRRVDEELTRAREKWNMRVRKIPSRTESDGSILCLEAISRVQRAP